MRSPPFLSLQFLLDTFDINRAPKKWHIQYKVGGPFLCQDRPLTDDNLRKHLVGDYWIATRPPDDGIRWLIFDIDAHIPSADPLTMWQKAQVVKEAFPNHKFSVATSPRGLHMYLKLPKRMQIWEAKAVYEDNCMRIKGLGAKGYIELFPKPTAVFRLPFGLSQRFLSWEE